jgi:LemA protein
MENVLIPLAVVFGFLLLVGLWVVVLYNGLVRIKNHCDESWSDIDTELKRRYDLIPNLVETVKGYAAHERDVFERVIAARNAAMANHGSPKEQARDENALVGCLRQLFAVVENYPVLKANENFLQLQEELVNTEDRIQRARRFYNANVRDMNNRVQTVPSNLIANLFGFSTREFFEIEDASVRQPPAVKLS